MVAPMALLPRIMTARYLVVPASRSMQLSTCASLMHKESSSQTDDDIDKHKTDSLRKQKEGGGAHWKRELASDSEEAVKADGAADESIETLQERTKRAAEENRKRGTSRNDGM